MLRIHVGSPSEVWFDGFGVGAKFAMWREVAACCATLRAFAWLPLPGKVGHTLARVNCRMHVAMHADNTVCR